MTARFRLLALVAFAAGVLALSLPGVAGAAQLTGPPDAAGKSMYCNVNYSQAVMPTTGSWSTWWSCNFGPTTATTISLTYRWSYYQSGSSGATSNLTSGTVTEAGNTCAGPGQMCFTVSHGVSGQSFAGKTVVPGSLVINSLTIGGQTGKLGGVVTQSVASGYPLRPSDYWAGGSAGQVATPVQTPSLSCDRSLIKRDGVWYSRVTARVLNPQAGTTDVVTTRFPWDTADGSATSAEVSVPSTGMPAGGWRGLCKVTRTVDTSASAWYGRTPFAVTGSGTGQVAGLLERQDVTDLTHLSANPQQSFVGSAGDGSALSTWITLATGGGTAGAAAATSGGLTVGTLGLVTGAGLLAAGVLYAGHKSGLVSLNPDECTLYDRLRQLVTWSHCPKAQELQVPDTTYLRSQTQFLDASGQVLTKTQLSDPNAQWKTATAVAEVLINPAYPDAGASTVTALEAPSPALTTEEWTSVQTDPAPDVQSDGGCGLSALEILNPFNTFKTIGCALKWAFVPDTVSIDQQWEEERNNVPLVILDEGVSGMGAIRDGLANMFDGGHCLDVDFRGIVPAEYSDGGVSSMLVHMPAPPGSGCASSTVAVDPDNDAGDLWGYRTLVRNVLLVGLFLGVMFMAIRAFGPNGDPNELEPKL
jgi:hypothetical protein